MIHHPMSAHLDSLAWHIDRFGFDATTQQHLHDIGLAAERAGVRPGLTELLADETAPVVVRGRAFGRIASLISRQFHGTPVVTCTDDQVACAA